MWKLQLKSAALHAIMYPNGSQTHTVHDDKVLQNQPIMFIFR